LRNRRPSPDGKVTVGGGRVLPYHEEGEIAGITFTTVLDLKYDLFSAVLAAKRGVTTVLDYQNGENRSYLYDKKRKIVTPLVETGGMLHIPMNDFLKSNATGLIISTEDGVALVHTNSIRF